MSVQIVEGWKLMCSPDLTQMRSDAMVSLIDAPKAPDALIDYVAALERAYLEHEFRVRRESCETMWEQWKDRPLKAPLTDQERAALVRLIKTGSRPEAETEAFEVLHAAMCKLEGR